MNIQDITRLLKIKYPDGYAVIILFDDDSGRITNSPMEPYNPENEPLFTFTDLRELENHLLEPKNVP